jgi:hypothetical protein
MKFAQSLQVAIKVSAVATVFAFSAVVSTAHADSLSATGIQKTQLEKLQFGNVAESTVNTGAFEVKLASAPTTPFWVYCLDPLEGFNNGTNATTSMSLFTYLNGGQYATQFSGSNYASAVSGGYQAQNTRHRAHQAGRPVLTRLQRQPDQQYQERGFPVRGVGSDRRH